MIPINVGNSEAAEQVVHMMLTGGEVAVRLAGSSAKNAAAVREVFFMKIRYYLDFYPHGTICYMI